MFTTSSFNKMPVAIQAVLGLALTVLGAWSILHAEFWADGDVRFQLLFFMAGVLYLVNGVPSLLEGAMTIFYGKRD